MRNKLIEFIEKYGMIIFAIWLLTVMSLQAFGQTRDSVYKELIKQGVKHPDIVLAQSILETGGYKCKNCSLDVNNIFGLWDSRKKRYFPYDTWQESIGGYLRGIQSRYKGGDYYTFLTKLGYAQDKEYINKLKQIK
tara:strand:+ start:201 stop:608 length:408 start_codon:yes stop_codon:yes gene_type:complete